MTATEYIKLNAIDEALGTKDRYTQGHARRVALYAMRLARKVGLSSEETGNIGLGGMLHDVGKIGWSPRVFREKTLRQCREMLDEVHRHPGRGVSLLRSMNFLTPILEYVYCHHERIDGSGYPRGLKDQEIPLGAKIIAVADCFDAITTDRPYRKRKNQAEAFEMLRKMAGGHLCSNLVEMFIEDIEANGMLTD
ncbi:MAG TPA: HD-GYP domain-containing protein [Desulfobacterales bacterium]